MTVMTRSDQVSKIYPPGQKVANIAPIAVKDLIVPVQNLKNSSSPVPNCIS